MARILAVEDDQALGYGLVYALEKENWEVTLARTLEEGRHSWEGQAFDLVLLDVMLPDGNGMDLCQRIRAESAVPIIFLTARDEEVSVVMGLDLGADDYVTKPFRVRELISRINARLRRSGISSEGPGTSAQTANGPVLRSGDLVVHTVEHTVTRQGVAIALTPVEFRLLISFLQHPLQTLTREQLLERLFDAEERYIDDNTLAVYVRRLREKIEPDPASPSYIQTIRGVGYRWNKRSGL